jgi:hypothetical protein
MHALAAYLRPLSIVCLCLAIVCTSFPGLVIASFCFGPAWSVWRLPLITS